MRKKTIPPPLPYDPLAGYPEMMSTRNLAEFLDIDYSTAWELVQRMPHSNVGLGEKRRSLRVTKQAVRERFNIPDPTNMRRVNFG